MAQGGKNRTSCKACKHITKDKRTIYKREVRSYKRKKAFSYKREKTNYKREKNKLQKIFTKEKKRGIRMRGCGMRQLPQKLQKKNR